MSFGWKIGIWVGLGLFVLLAVLLLTGVFKPFEPNVQSANLVVWDVPAHERVMGQFFRDYAEQNPGVRIDYQTKSSDTYVSDLLEALASGAGPDIFLLDSASLAKNQNKIAPLPSSSSLTQDFLAKASDAIASDLIDENRNLYGIPWSVDTLALYYNKDYLNAINVPEPPKTWVDFQDVSRRLTRRSPTGVIQRSGAAFGLGRNVVNAADIFSLLILQSNNPFYSKSDKQFHLNDAVVVNDRSQKLGLSALQFYAAFASPSSPYYTWNSSLPEAKEAFASGRAALYLGYARELPEIMARNSHLNFGIAPVPQLVAGDRTSYASYEFFTVSKSSPVADAAWQVLASLFDPAVEKNIVDQFAIPPARRDLVNEKPVDPILQPFYDQVLSARTWRIPDKTVARKIISDALDAVVGGVLTPDQALDRIQTQLQLLVPRS